MNVAIGLRLKLQTEPSMYVIRFDGSRTRLAINFFLRFYWGVQFGGRGVETAAFYRFWFFFASHHRASER